MSDFVNKEMSYADKLKYQQMHVLKFLLSAVIGLLIVGICAHYYASSTQAALSMYIQYICLAVYGATAGWFVYSILAQTLTIEGYPPLLKPSVLKMVTTVYATIFSVVFVTISLYYGHSLASGVIALVSIALVQHMLTKAQQELQKLLEL